MKTINDRYEIVNLLSRGSNEVEYLVIDQEKSNQLKRMRIFDAEMSNSQFVKNMEEDFILLKNMIHENLLSVYEFQTIKTINGSPVSRKQYFYTYEHWLDEERVSYLELTKSEINAVLVGLCKVLRYLHFRGIIYKYLNFDQMIILRKDRKVIVKLKDVAGNGINDYYYNSEYDRYNHFLAPEILWGEEIDETVDIYSLATVFFYIYYQIDHYFKNIKESIGNDSSNEIHLFIGKATSAIREERFQNMKAFITRLSELIWTEVDRYDYIYYDKIHRHIKIAGRDAIVSEIRTAIEEKNKKSGQYDVVVINGDSGSGKTRLLREIKQISKFNRYDYIYIKFDTIPHDPYYTARKVLNYIKHKDDVSPVLIQKYGQEIGSLQPELIPLWNIKLVEAIDLKREHLRIFNRIFNFFLEYSSTHFIVLIIDEVGRIHSKERIFYEMLLSAQENGHYFLLFSSNQWQFNQMALSHRVKNIKLPSLTYEETGELVRTALGCKDIPYSLTHRLMMESQGKASKIESLLRQLWQEKYIFFDREKMEWNLDRIDDQFSFEHVEKREYQYDILLQNFEEDSVKLLKKLSVLTDSFNQDLVVAYGGISYDESLNFLTKMEEAKVLNRRISDVEYVYVFFSNELRKYFFNLVPYADKQKLYKALIQYFEELFKEKGILTESIIDYCINCGEDEKAAYYCILYAKRYGDLFNYQKSAELMERGIELYKKLNQNHYVLEYGYMLIQQLIKAGRLDFALKMIDALEVYKDRTNTFYNDILSEKAFILYYKSDYNTALTLLDDNIKSAEELGYVEGRLKAIYVQCKCLEALQKDDQHFLKYSEGYELAKEHQSIYYEGLFLNEQGIHYLGRSKYQQALERFIEALDLFKTIAKEDLVIRSLNNIGAVYYEGFGDFIQARDYFRKAYHRAQTINDLMAMPTQLSNLGETYSAEERHEMAIKYYEQANQIAERIGDKAIILQALLNLCGSYIGNENYSKAHILMTRLEHEHASFINGRDHLVEYYFLHLEYFIAMNDFMALIKWYNDSPKINENDSYKAFRFKIIELKVEQLQNKRVGEDANVPFERLKDLVEKIEKPLYAKHMRNFLHDIMYERLSQKDYLSVTALAELDDQLIELYNSKTVRIKREVIDASFSEYPVERMLMILKDMEGASDEIRWRTYHIVADLYCVKGDLYNALKYNLMALDIIFQLSMHVPQAFKSSYILYDQTKVKIKDHIMRIMDAITLGQSLAHCDGIVEQIPTLDLYFDLSRLNQVYLHPRFEKMIVTRRPNIFEKRFNSATDFIQNLKKDEIINLKIMLSYLAQMTYSDRASVYILDENDMVSETIIVGEGDAPSDLSRFINNVSNDMDGYFISRLDSKSSVKLLVDPLKGVLFLPVYEQENQTARNQRREDLLVLKKRIAGYVLLESFSVIHRLNDDVLDQAKRFMNLFYVFIDNYNLKRVSAIDKLTGVYLRKFIEQQFAIQLSVARQNGERLSVMMLDIDKFKNVNDTYGHRKGDEILSKLGEILKESVRNTDYVARYGGEEFIVLLPQTQANEAYKAAEKIRRVVEDRKLLGDGKKLTVSLGISTYPKDGSNEEELIEKADKALYYSKNNGRNQSTSWDEHLIKEGHRYDKLTGVLTGNISADTRNVQTMLDVMNQLDPLKTREEQIRNIFISLLDITEAEEIQYIRLDQKKNILETFGKRKGHEQLETQLLIGEKLVEHFAGMENSDYFINWEEQPKDEGIPDWRSYIVTQFEVEDGYAFMATSVRIVDKEFDFSNYNFVETLKPVIRQVFVGTRKEQE